MKSLGETMLLIQTLVNDFDGTVSVNGPGEYIYINEGMAKDNAIGKNGGNPENTGT